MQQKRKVHNVVKTGKRQPVWQIPVLDLIRLQVLTVIESEPIGETGQRDEITLYKKYFLNFKHL